MTETESQHEWRIINIRNGYLVTERCVETGARQSFFSLEDTPPIDNYTVFIHLVGTVPFFYSI